MSDEAIFVAASGALVQGTRLDVLSNNLANINTIGFKADRAVFSHYLSESKNSASPTDLNLQSDDPREISSSSPSNIKVKLDGTKTDFSPGQLRQTGNPLDFALEGDGFFCIETQNGIQQYTRKGTFTFNENGALVTQEGALVLGENGRSIKINPEDRKNISVDEEGGIIADGSKLDTIKVVDFSRPYSLMKAGNAAFLPVNSAVVEQKPEDVRIKQGVVELSNVNPIKTMTEMIEVHRAFESYQKVIRSMDEVLSRSIDEVGRAL